MRRGASGRPFVAVRLASAPLDVEVRAAGFHLIRYADDFVILADRRWKAEAADRLVRAILADIGLEVAEAKSGIVKVNTGFEFLGFSFSGRYG